MNYFQKNRMQSHAFTHILLKMNTTLEVKVGQTIRDVKNELRKLKTAAIKNYTIDVDESAVREDGTIFSDHVRRSLVKRGLRT